MELFDTHSHYNDKAFSEDLENVLEKVKNSGVTKLVCIGYNLKSSKKAVELAQKYDFIYATVGVHPSDTKDMTDDDIETLKQLAKHKKVVAIGEIGLDYHYDDTDPETQKIWFRKQLDLAKELDMPVVIHDRESKGECIKILKEKNITNGVFHCFSGSAETAKEILKMGFHISFTGVLTFKNARRALEALEVIPLEKLFIETDCPYMAPEPFRGTRNDSSLVYRVAEKMAEIKDLSVQEIINITTENAKHFFNI